MLKLPVTSTDQLIQDDNLVYFYKLYMVGKLYQRPPSFSNVSNRRDIYTLGLIRVDAESASIRFWAPTYSYILCPTEFVQTSQPSAHLGHGGS